MRPRPPALETAAASAGVTAPPIGARTIGASIPRSSVKAVRTTSFSHRGRRAGQRHAALSVSLLRGERLAGLEQRLHAAEDVHPASGDVLSRLRCALELVVHDRQFRDATTVLRLDLPPHATRLLSRRLFVVEGPPGVAEPPRRIGVENLAVGPQLLSIRGPTSIRRTRLEGRVDEAAVEIAARGLRDRDRLPDVLSARLV